jgi:hypothetical protein
MQMSEISTINLRPTLFANVTTNEVDNTIHTFFANATANNVKDTIRTWCIVRSLSEALSAPYENKERRYQTNELTT